MTDSIKLLLIEDNPGDVVLFKHACQGQFGNMEIIEASSVHKAQELIKARNIDVVFTDLNTPDSIGASAIKDLRAIKPELPVIVLTGIGTDLTRDECRKAGALGFMLKSELSSNKIAEMLKACGLMVINF